MTNLIVKNLLVTLILLYADACGNDKYEAPKSHHNCDISNNSNDTVMVDFFKIYVNHMTYDYDYYKLSTTKALPKSVTECRSLMTKRYLIERCDSFRFVFYKNGGNPSEKDDVLAIRPATVDSLEKWGWVVTYP